jgi:recombination protein RecR
MPQYSRPIQNVIEAFAKLPGIGLRSAERIAFHLLKTEKNEALRLADAVRDLKTKIRHCDICFNLAEAPAGGDGTNVAQRGTLCEICADPARDASLVCVVEQPKDLIAIEAAGGYKGVFHVLLGRIAPLEGVDAGDLTLHALLTRLDTGTIREVILGTNPTMEGDTTALHITESIHAVYPNVNVTRLARGLPTGSSIEYANRNMLADAMAGRQRM